MNYFNYFIILYKTEIDMQLHLFFPFIFFHTETHNFKNVSLYGIAHLGVESLRTIIIIIIRWIRTL